MNPKKNFLSERIRQRMSSIREKIDTTNKEKNKEYSDMKSKIDKQKKEIYNYQKKEFLSNGGLEKKFDEFLDLKKKFKESNLDEKHLNKNDFFEKKEIKAEATKNENTFNTHIPTIEETKNEKTASNSKVVWKNENKV